MPSGYTSRSLQSVRRVGPESSRLLRIAEDLKDKGFLPAANKIAADAAGIKVSESPVDNPMQRQAREAAQQAIAVGQQAAIQGDFNPAAVVAPMKQQFFGAVNNLPIQQRNALLNRFEPQFREQRMQNMVEQQSFLQLKDAQRKAKMNQDIDAVKVQVQQRLAQINPLATAKEKSKQIQSIVRQNPNVLGDMATVRNINMMYEPINKELSAEQGREASKFQAGISMAASLANKGVINKQLLKSIGSGKDFSSLLEQAATENTKLNARTSSSKFHDDLLTQLSKGTINDIKSSVREGLFNGASLNTLRSLQVLETIKSREANGEAIDVRIKQIENFKTQGKDILSSSGYKGTTFEDFPKYIRAALTYFLAIYQGGAIEIFKNLGGSFPLTDDKSFQEAVGSNPNKKDIENAILNNITDPDSYQNFLTAIQSNILFKDKPTKSSLYNSKMIRGR